MNRRLYYPRHLPLVIAALVVLNSGSIAGAQDYDELFAQTDDDRFAFFDQASGSGENLSQLSDDMAADQRSDFESLPTPTQLNDRNPSPSQYNDTITRSSSDLRLSDRSGSQPAVRQPSKAMQIRQARALAEMRSRDARLDAERWGLLPSLRPSWSSSLMTQSRHPANITYFVPVYVWGR